MPLFDTHAHLDDRQFEADLTEVLARARATGVERVICVATTAQDSASCIAIAARFPSQVSASVGIQPNHVSEAGAGDWDTILKLVEQPGVVAIGETGLDRYWDRAPFAVQEDYFARHLELARAQHKPVIIHCREAEADVVRMLKGDFEKHGPVRGVMHSFTGDLDTAQACLAMGLYISIAGMVTYKTAQNLRDVAKQVPAERLLVETDCPYLAPVPMRGKRNEPAYVAHTLACLAKERGEPAEQLAAATYRNAMTFFGFS